MVERSGPVPEEELNLTYDYENRLVEGSVPERGLTLNYSYDPFGKRLSKTVNGSTKYYLYDNEDIIVEYDAVGSLTASYLHGQGIDEPISSSLPGLTGQSIYYTFDGLGSVVELTDGSGNVVESYKYDSFGNIETPPATGNPYTYTGREYDSESGLYYYRARYYDPAIGRFITADPILLPRIKYKTYKSAFLTGEFLTEWKIPDLLRLPDSQQPYIYVENNPLNRLDPTGEECLTVSVALISVTVYFLIYLITYYCRPPCKYHTEIRVDPIKPWPKPPDDDCFLACTGCRTRGLPLYYKIPACFYCFVICPFKWLGTY